jgi:hypothetical protein
MEVKVVCLPSWDSEAIFILCVPFKGRRFLLRRKEERVVSDGVDVCILNDSDILFLWCKV